MTKIKTKSHRVPVYRRPLFIIVILLVLAAGAIFVFLHLNQTPATDPDDEPVAAPSPAAVDPATPAESAADNPPEEPDRPTQFEGEDPNELDTLTGRIAYRGVDTARGVLSITASIDQYLSSGGECHLSLYRASTTVYSANLAASPDATTSVCGPFEVPLDRLSSGSYNITIKITSDDKSGTITSEVEI